MRNVISTLADLLEAVKAGAEATMQSDPPPAGPEYKAVQFHPSKPSSFPYLDTSGKDLKIEYTYCLGFYRTTSKNFPVNMRDYVYCRQALPTQQRQRCGPCKSDQQISIGCKLVCPNP